MRGSARRVRVALAAALASSFLALGAGPMAPTVQAAPPVNCTPDAKLVNPCRPLFGAYSNTYPTIRGWRPHMDAEEVRVGRALDIVHLYHPPGSAAPLLPDEKYFATRPNTTMFTNWKPAAKWADAGGGNTTVNAQIDQVADSIKSVAPTKILLTIHHEPEPDVTSGTSTCPGLKGAFGSPADYRAMWKNIEERFAARGVTNVVWVMNYMSYKAWDCLAPELWPGNDLVDWVMYDPYDTSATSSWSASVSRFYKWMLANSDASHDYVSKPWGLAEFGVGGSTTQAHAYAYYDAAKASVERNDFPRLKAYVVFDSEGTAKTRTSYSVAGVYDPIEQQHFNALANSRVFADPPRDTSPPSVTLLQPTTGDSVHGSVPIKAATSDDSGVSFATYAVDDGPWVPMPTTPGGLATATWDSETVEDGAHALLVRAVDESGNTSTATAQVTVTNVDTTPPTTPANFRTRLLTADQVDLAWDESTDDRGVTGYRVTRDGETLPSGALTRFTDSSARPGTTYLYEVVALDAAGNSSPDTAALTVLTPDTEDTDPPSTPGLTARVTGDDVVLTWTAAMDESGVLEYKVFRGDDLVTTVDGGVLTFTDANLAQGQSYDYSVQAFDVAGNSSERSSTQRAPIPDTTPPSVPTQPTALENPPLGGVYVGWNGSTDNIGVTSYTVSRNGVALDSVPTPGYIDTTVAPGTAYDYTVTATDAAGNTSAASTPVRVLTADLVAPAAPARPSASLAGSAVKLTWTATTDNVGVQGYRVQRDGREIASVAGTTYTDTGAPQGASHSYAIVAFDAANNASSASSALTVAVPDTTPPAAPAKPTVTLTSGKGTLAWKAPTDNIGVTKYVVKRDGAILVTTAGTTYTDATVKQGKTYAYTVTAYDAANNASPASPAKWLVVPDTVAPTKPASFKVVAGARKATLTWTAATDNVAVKGYEIWRGSTRIITTTGTSFVNTGLTKGTSYSYRIRAYDAKGNFSAYTAVVTIKSL